jgi:phage shock protein E
MLHLFLRPHALLLALFVAACSDAGVTEAQVAAMQAVADGALLVDVRSAAEFAGGHLEGAINIPHPQIVEGLAGLGADPAAPVVLYCRSGNRSGIATTSLRNAGYGNVTNAGAFEMLRRVPGVRSAGGS